MKSFDEIMLDPKFIEYMDYRSVEGIAYWENLVKTGLVNSNDFKNAKRLYKALSKHDNETISKKEKHLASVELLNRIGKHERLSSGKRLPNSTKKWIGVAAALIVLVGMFVSLWFNIKHMPVSNDIVYNEITVPSGEKSTIKLSDGTVVWLNSESKLRYPSSFNSNNRDVYLEGEGYFDVAKQKGKKFTVNTQNVKVIALGTIFDVKSYPDDDIIEATLVEGSIKFQQVSDEKQFPEIILEPDQKLVFQKDFGKATVNSLTDDKEISNDTNVASKIPSYSVKKVNTSNIVCWKDHLLVFENEPFEEIGKKMSRWYKMQVIIQDKELKELHFTGKFIHNETYIQVLEAIDLTTPLSYYVEDNTIFIHCRKVDQSTENISN